MTGSNDAKGAAQAICSNPALLAETKEVAASLAMAAEPAGVRQVAALVHRLFVQFGLRDVSAEQKATITEPYLEALAEIPISCLEGAVRAWNKGELYPDEPKRHSFMPQPSELVWLAKSRREKLHIAAYRAKLALDYREKAPKPPPTAEEIAAVKAMAAELSGKLGAGREMPSDAQRPIAGNRQEVADRLRRLADEGPEEMV